MSFTKDTWCYPDAVFVVNRDTFWRFLFIIIIIITFG